MLTYNWTDINRDGRLWTDRDGDGVVDQDDSTTSSNIDGDLDIDFARSEIDQGEYVRFMYHRAGSNALQSFVRDPAERMADGIFLGLQHSARERRDPGHRLRGPDRLLRERRLAVGHDTLVGRRLVRRRRSTSRPDTPYGMYSGAIVLTAAATRWSSRSRWPWRRRRRRTPTASSPARSTFGGADVAERAGRPALQQRLGLRRERLDVAGRVRRLAVLLLRRPDGAGRGLAVPDAHEWEDTAPFTDLDTLILGRSANDYQLVRRPVFGRRTSSTPSAGARTRTSAPACGAFDTATGGADGRRRRTGAGGPARGRPCTRSAGRATSSTRRSSRRSAARRSTRPSVEHDTRRRQRLVRRDVHVDRRPRRPRRPRASASASRVTTETAQQDDPNDPSTASVKRDVTLDHASRLTVSTELGQQRHRPVRRLRREQRRRRSRTTRSSRRPRPATGERVRRADARRRRLPGLGAGLAPSPARRRSR